MRLCPLRFTCAAVLLTALFAFTVSPVPGHPAYAAAVDAPAEAPAMPTARPPRGPEVPPTMPDNIANLCPTYPGALLLQVAKGEKETRAMFKSAASPAEIAAYYKKELTGRGWTIFKEMSEDNSSRLILNKDQEQIGFSAIKHPSKVVTYFISLRNK